MNRTSIGMSLGIVGALLVPPSAMAQVETPGTAETLLEVASTGEALAAPDRATINAGVVTLAPTAADAVAANAEKMKRLTAALRAVGVEAGDTQTSTVSLTPNQTWNATTGPQITGYSANNSLRIVLRDPRRVSDVITAAFGGGANNVNGPNFALSNATKAIAEARADAVKRAREQADTYAAAFGMRVVRVIRISERGNRSSYAPAGDAMVYASNVNLRMSAPPAPAPAPPPTLAPTSVESGQIRQSVNLWVDFALTAK